VIPFDYLLVNSGGGSFNRVARFVRIGKLYKIIRLTKMVRILKIVQLNNKFIKNLSEMLRINAGFERLIFLALLFFVLEHVVSCLWIFIANFDPGTKNNWIYQKDYLDMENLELYVTSFYFTTTTILTVGYGDITAFSLPEKLLCIILMIIGVISFSFATGALSSIISNYDSSEALLNEKISKLNSIQSTYKIDASLYKKCMQTVRYDHSRKSKDYIEFLSELPHMIKLELAMEIHKQMYVSVNFFKDRSKSFIAWIGNVLKPFNVCE
jgi:voltage-gated potassium channel